MLNPDRPYIWPIVKQISITFAVILAIAFAMRKEFGYSWNNPEIIQTILILSGILILLPLIFTLIFNKIKKKRFFQNREEYEVAQKKIQKIEEIAAKGMPDMNNYFIKTTLKVAGIAFIVLIIFIFGLYIWAKYKGIIN